MSRAQPRSLSPRALGNFSLLNGPPVDHAVSRKLWSMVHQIIHAGVGWEQGKERYLTCAHGLLACQGSLHPALQWTYTL
jgi:hypothetical protein